MNDSSSPSGGIQQLLYGDDLLEDDLVVGIEELDSERDAERKAGNFSRPSIYVKVFEEMVNTVHNGETHLLSKEEIDMLGAFSNLTYNARYCLVRLLLRKSNTWHTLKSMEKFKKEVSEEGLLHAISSLCGPIENESDVKQEVKEEPTVPEVPEREIIDLTSDDEETKPDISSLGSSPPSRDEQDIKPSLDALLNRQPTYEPDFSFFLEDESCMTLEEVLKKLSNDQLRELVKDTKVKPEKMTKDGMIYALRLYASTQQPLNFMPATKNRRKQRSDGLKQTLLPFRWKGNSTPETQENRLHQMALEKLGKCVRVNVDLYWLVIRLNVIYERSTEYPKSLLVPSLLMSFKKRTYAKYNCTRSNNIWSSREELMDYVEALRLEAAFQNELEPSSERATTKTPAPAQNKFVTPITPGQRRNWTTPLRTPMSAARATESPTICKKEKEEDVDDEALLEVGEPPPLKIQAAWRVKQVFNEVVLPKWLELVEEGHAQGVHKRTPGLERFEPGFVYTRIFSHAMRAFATLKLYAEENEALILLVKQPFWKVGKRAKWYVRQAILHTTHLCRDPDPEQKVRDIVVLRRAMEHIKEALRDDNTHLIYRPDLVRRLMRIEKQLKIPEEDRSFCDGELRKAEIVQFEAEKIMKTDKGLAMDAHGRPIQNTGLKTYFSPLKVGGTTPNGRKVSGSADVTKPPAAETSKSKVGGKSVWRGRNGENVNVETRALQYYEDHGYKGFHSETRILTTLFGLLFWDIIFADVPGAFETVHQIAPLDLAENSFYLARKDLIDARLEEIKQTARAQEIVKQHDDLHRPKDTWCVGIRWDICTKDELLEIVECIGGEPLAFICRLFCEDYAGRCSGVPDLIVWSVASGVCKFVEVKGPGDRPQENQKLWFDSLIAAGANVEICKVLDKDNPPKPPKKKTAKQRGTSSKGKSKARSVESEDEIDFDGLDTHDASPREASYTSPLNLRKRRRPPDENTQVVQDSTSIPGSPSALSSRRPNHAMTPPVKKQKLDSP